MSKVSQASMLFCRSTQPSMTTDSVLVMNHPHWLTHQLQLFEAIIRPSAGRPCNQISFIWELVQHWHASVLSLLEAWISLLVFLTHTCHESCCVLRMREVNLPMIPSIHAHNLRYTMHEISYTRCASSLGREWKSDLISSSEVIKIAQRIQVLFIITCKQTSDPLIL